jgi:hypothetical protein
MDELNEIWKAVKGFEGKYEVSNLGNLRSLNHRGMKGVVRNMKPRENDHGYYYTSLMTLDNKRQTKYIHRIVAEQFCDNPENKLTVNHKDENKSNNAAANLEWLTAAENNSYGSRTTRTEKPVVAFHPISKHTIYFKSIREAEKMGFSGCRISIAANGRNNTKEHKGYRWYFLNEWEEINSGK